MVKGEHDVKQTSNDLCVERSKESHDGSCFRRLEEENSYEFQSSLDYTILHCLK